MTATPFSAGATLLSAGMSLEEVAALGVPMLEESSHPQAYLQCGEIHDLGRTWADLRPLETVTLYESDEPQYVDWGPNMRTSNLRTRRPIRSYRSTPRST
jgi:hypothetical protein